METQEFSSVIDPNDFKPRPCPGCGTVHTAGPSGEPVHNIESCMAFQRGYQAGYEMAKLDAVRAFGAAHRR